MQMPMGRGEGGVLLDLDAAGAGVACGLSTVVQSAALEPLGFVQKLLWGDVHCCQSPTAADTAPASSAKLSAFTIYISRPVRAMQEVRFSIFFDPDETSCSRV
jgi:hypothetical protein